MNWMQIMREMCNIYLMSDFVGSADGMPAKGAIFVEKVGRELKCVMQGRKNKRIEYFLDLNVDASELTMETLQRLKEKIIEKIFIESNLEFFSLPEQPVQDDLCRIFDFLDKDSAYKMKKAPHKDSAYKMKAPHDFHGGVISISSGVCSLLEPRAISICPPEHLLSILRHEPSACAVAVDEPNDLRTWKREKSDFYDVAYSHSNQCLMIGLSKCVDGKYTIAAHGCSDEDLLSLQKIILDSDFTYLCPIVNDYDWCLESSDPRELRFFVETIDAMEPGFIDCGILNNLELGRQYCAPKVGKK